MKKATTTTTTKTTKPAASKKAQLGTKLVRKEVWLTHEEIGKLLRAGDAKGFLNTKAFIEHLCKDEIAKHEARKLKAKTAKKIKDAATA